MKSSRSVRFISTAAGIVIALLSVAQFASATSPPVAKAVIWSNLTITVSPKSIEAGTVVFKIKNRDVRNHWFSIDGIRSTKIKPRSTVAMTVTLKKPGVYFFTLGDPDGATEVGTKQVGGTLRVR